MSMYLSFKFRVKDSAARWHLARHARATNFVWNYLCETQRTAESRWMGGTVKRWPTAYDLIRLCAGATADLNLQAKSIEAICLQFTRSRDAKRYCPRFRSSGGAKRSLGWIPFNEEAVQVRDNTIIGSGSV